VIFVVFVSENKYDDDDDQSKTVEVRIIKFYTVTPSLYSFAG